METSNPIEEEIKQEVTSIITQEQNLQTLEAELMQNEEFRNFLLQKRQLDSDLAAFWGRIEEQMIEHDIKQIKGDWGTLTIAEKLGWEIDLEQLPAKFIKKVADTKRLSDTFRLENKPIKGATPKFSKYLTKRFK